MSAADRERVPEASSALLTDLYELTMLQAYFDEGLAGEAVFELHFRTLPRNRNFLIAGGIEQVLTYLEGLSFSPDDLDYLDRLKLFTPRFLASLQDFRFTGAVRAMPEGTLVFPYEPILEIEAPI